MTPTLIARVALGGALSLGLGLAACSSEADDAGMAATPPPAEMAAAQAEGGASTSASRTVVDAAAASPNHTTLVAAVQAAGLGETLSGSGPFTVFAPTDAAFAKLPAGTVQSLTQPAQKPQLTAILTYHVVPGRITAADLTRQIQAGGGSATLTTVNGARLTARAAGGGVQLTDGAGGMSMVTQADMVQSNGVVHVIDTVLMPRG